MVEVFKTNVNDVKLAEFLLAEIHTTFVGYSANFDLDDCDKILRIECKTDSVQVCEIIKLIKGFDCDIEVLEDIVPDLSFDLSSLK